MDAVAAGRGQESSPQPTQALSVDPYRAVLSTSPDRRPGPDAATPLLRPGPSHTPPLLDPRVSSSGAQTWLLEADDPATPSSPCSFKPHQAGSRAARAAPTPGPHPRPSPPSPGTVPAPPQAPGATGRGRVPQRQPLSRSAGLRPSPWGPGAAARGSPGPRSWPPAARWTLRALSASASWDPFPGPCQVPPGSLRPPSRESPPAALLPCGELGALGPARWGSAGGAAPLQEMPED